MSNTEANSLPASPVLDQTAAQGGAVLSGGRSKRGLQARLGAATWPPIVAALALMLMAALTILIVVDASIGHSPMAPPAPRLAYYLHFLSGGRLSYYTFLPALLVITLAYALVLALARHVSSRMAITAIVGLHAIVFAGPILLSQDVFSYLAYARDATLHGINPYLHGPHAAQGDPIYRYVGQTWKTTLTAYGPLWTVLSYPFGLLGVRGGLWGLKLVGVLSSLTMVALVWRCARLRGRDPRLPAMIVGLNPITFLYSVGGTHNDLLMAALMMLGVYLALRDRDRDGAAMIIAGAAVKVTAAAVVPFMVLARRRTSPIVGAVAAAVVLGALALVVFGPHSLDVAATLRRQQSFVSSDSFPNEIAHLFGKPGVFPVDRDLLRVSLVITVLYLLLITWRGYDWVSASAWTMLAIAVTTTWLLAWYTLWALPLAAVSRDRRVLWATLAVQGMFIFHQFSPLLSPRL